LKLIKIQTDNSDWKALVFDQSDNPVGEFYASKNLDPRTNREYPFDITFESSKYDELMAKILDKQDDIQDWLVDVHSAEKLFL
jgi:hypothetical protein